MRETKRSAWRRGLPLVALLVVAALTMAACGGSDDDSGSGGGGSSTGEEGTPKPGGKLTYGLEAATSNFCIPGAQLAISGIMVVQAVYDTLTRPTAEPDVYAPYLAKTVTPNADSTQWTIVLRDGITFHDGTPLTADVVKQNIDAWRKGILLQFVYSNIADTAVTAPNTVVVTMKTPWVAFPAYLWTTGRSGIAAPAQLNDEATCATNMIGTGPFSLKSFDPTTGDVSVVKNESYWREGFPYLDAIDFKPQEESSQRVNGLQGGQFDAIMGSGGKDLNTIEGFGSGFTIVLEPEGRQEISHSLPNVSLPPFDNKTARLAIAKGINRDELNAIANDGEGRITNQVFDTDIMGYLDDPGFPKYDPKEAKKLADEYKDQNNGVFEFDLQSTYDQTTQDLAREVKTQLAEIGITVNLPPATDQGEIIDLAIANEVDAFLWRNYPGQDPDTLYVWFYGGSIVNFNKIDDPVMNQALDTGRSSQDEATRQEAYETFNRRMSSEVYNLWSWYTQWFVASNNTVKGITGPDLPDENGEDTIKPVPMLAGYHQLLGMWIDQ